MRGAIQFVENHGKNETSLWDYLIKLSLDDKLLLVEVRPEASR